MLKSEMQHQYWITKKAVQRKLGGKEDECVVSSDAELDAKIELFKSIAESCTQLHRVIDLYQERLCVLAQEENNLGRFLKEAGKNSATTGKVMINTGKSISHSGQQRLAVRAPLVRLHHEVETFRGRAIVDTKETIVTMERERTEYRAALSWMKSASGQLDPDSGKGVDKFRKAQNHVRQSKAKFDRIALDCLQKIDLLAAARCNMFSHALVAYQQALVTFFTKTTETFQAASKSLTNEPHYNFSILKELTQAEKIDEIAEEAGKEKTASDSDQMLFFQDEFKDDDVPSKKETTSNSNQNELIGSYSKTESDLNLIDIPLNGDGKKSSNQQLLDELKIPNASSSSDDVNADLLGISNSEFGDFVSAQPPSYMPSQLLLNDLAGFDFSTDDPTTMATNLLDCISSPPGSTADKLETSPTRLAKPTSATSTKNAILDLFSKIPLSNSKNEQAQSGGVNGENNNSKGMSPVTAASSSKTNKEKLARKDMSAWFQLFAELDPLANPDAIENKIDKSFSNNSHAA